VEFSVSPGNREAIWRQLADQVRAAVAQGVLRPGDRLPSVRELARRLVVNPNTIARTYQELEHEGLVHTRQGLGVFIAAGVPPKALCQRELTELTERFLTEAVLLGCRPAEVLDAVSDAIERYHWQGE